jgi:lipoprotein NlpI
MLRLTLLIAFLAGDVSWTQANEAVEKCAAEAERNDFNLSIDFCTVAIQSGQLSDQELAIIFNNRAFAYYNKRDYQQAIRDYDRAISLQPHYALALTRRGAALLEKRQYEQALADYEAATQLDAKSVSDRSKGFLFFFLGRMTQSAETFENYLKSEPDDIGVILFRYLVEAKIGNALAAARELEADSAKLKERHWPMPIIDFHLGKIDETALFAAANDADSSKRSEQICAANFHAGEARLLRANVTTAIDLLRTAEKVCPSHLYESHGATTELERLGQKR